MALNHLHCDRARLETSGGRPASPPARDDADDARESLALIAYVSPVSTSKHAAHGDLRECAESQLRTPVSTLPAGPPPGARKAGKRPLEDDGGDKGQTSSPAKHFRGVTERKSSVNSFIARCRLNGIRHHLGSFSTAEGAACAYDTFAFAHGRTELNFEYAPGSGPQLIEQPKQPRTLLVVDARAEPQQHDSEDVYNNGKHLRSLQSSSTRAEQGSSHDHLRASSPDDAAGLQFPTLARLAKALNELEGEKGLAVKAELGFAHSSSAPPHAWALDRKSRASFPSASFFRADDRDARPQPRWPADARAPLLRARRKAHGQSSVEPDALESEEPPLGYDDELGDGERVSKFRGVRYDRRNRSKPWTARVTIDGKKYYIGPFLKEVETAVEFDRFMLSHHREAPNFPDEWRRTLTTSLTTGKPLDLGWALTAEEEEALRTAYERETIDKVPKTKRDKLAAQTLLKITSGVWID
ncbi:hypothetical protein T492DRAFT_850158 [Pavlovales sp. CCMP2436]|nr:hypothetical protein T492DRAFT_850158 [Pavlovales sp. CCMP2436]